MFKKVLLVVLALLLAACLFACGKKDETPEGEGEEQTPEAAAVLLPDMTADNRCTSYKGSDGSEVHYYMAVKPADYNEYRGQLEEAGYTERQSYEGGGCRHSLWENDAYTVYVSYLPDTGGNTKKGRVRVFTQAVGTPYNLSKTAANADVCTPMLWQLDVDNSVGKEGGMSYVIRLTDGTFVIIDGGYGTDKEARNLYATLFANNPLPGKPVVTAWFITHLHADHYAVLGNMARRFGDRVTIKGFYYNFPDDSLNDKLAAPSNGNYTSLIDTASEAETKMKLWPDAVRYSKLHSGMVLGFAGATVEVLLTHEDVCQSYYENGVLQSNGFEKDGNNTSTVLRINVAGQKILFLADAEFGVSQQLTGTYTADYLKSDIMQMAHHGFSDGVKPALITAVRPSVVLWPMDIIKYNASGTPLDNFTNTFGQYVEFTENQDADIGTVKRVTSEIIPAGENVALELPYTANTVSATKIPDYETMRAAKLKVLNAAVNVNVRALEGERGLAVIGLFKGGVSTRTDFTAYNFTVAVRTEDGVCRVLTGSVTEVGRSVTVNGKELTASSFGSDVTAVCLLTLTDDLPAGTVEVVATGSVTVKTDGAADYTFNYATNRYQIDLAA